MSDISVDENVLLTQEQKQEKFSVLCKAANKALTGAFNLEETEKTLKQNVVLASENVNTISKKLGDGEEHNREEYNAALKELTRSNRKLDKFLDNYEDLRDNSGSKLKELRDFIDQLISDMTTDQVS